MLERIRNPKAKGCNSTRGTSTGKTMPPPLFNAGAVMQISQHSPANRQYRATAIPFIVVIGRLLQVDVMLVRTDVACRTGFDPYSNQIMRQEPSPDIESPVD